VSITKIGILLLYAASENVAGKSEGEG